MLVVYRSEILNTQYTKLNVQFAYGKSLPLNIENWVLNIRSVIGSIKK